MPIVPCDPYPGSLGDTMMEEVAWEFADPKEVVVIGADVADGTYGPRHWWSRTPDRIVSMSWSNNASAKAIAAFQRFAQQGSVRMFVRDKYSHQRLVRDVPAAANCSRVTADLAFLANENDEPPAALQDFLSHDVAALMPTETFPGNLLKGLLKSGFRVIVIQHDLRRGAPMAATDQNDFSDYVASGRLFTYIPSNPGGYRQVRAILRRCKLALSGRLHGCISSLAVETPTMMIGEYRDKARGVFAQFDLEHLVASSPADAAGRYEAFIRSLSDVKDVIRSRLPVVKRLAMESF